MGHRMGCPKCEGTVICEEQKMGSLGDQALPNILDTLTRQREFKQMVGTDASLASLTSRAALQRRRRPTLKPLGIASKQKMMPG
jgi:hypothetical protein